MNDKVTCPNTYRIAEAEDSVEILSSFSLDRELVRDFAAACHRAFESLWNNPEDAAYDAL